MENLEKWVTLERKAMPLPSQVRVQLDAFVNGVWMNGALRVLLGLPWLLAASEELLNDTVTDKSAQREGRFVVRCRMNIFGKDKVIEWSM